MTNEISELRQTWLATEYTITEIEKQRDELAEKVKKAIASGLSQDLPDLRRQLTSVEAFELPVAQAAAQEAAIKFLESEAAEYERQAETAHARLDEVSNRRNERMKQISEEYRDLQIDASGEIAEANRVLMQVKHHASQSREQAAKRRQQLAELQQQVANK